MTLQRRCNDVAGTLYKFSHIDEMISDLKRQLREEEREEITHLRDKRNHLTNLDKTFELLHALRQAQEPEQKANTARYIPSKHSI